MLKENQVVKIKWNSFTKKYYESLGYEYTKVGEEFDVKIQDLQHGSHAKVVVICDFCNKEYTKTYKDFFAQHNGGDCCAECEGVKSTLMLEKKNGKGSKYAQLKDGVYKKYGVNNSIEIPGIKEKIKETNTKKYGVSTPLILPENIGLGAKASWEKESRDIRKNTCIEKYGVECVLQSPEIRQKINDSYLKNGTIKTSKQQEAIYSFLKECFSNCYINYQEGKYWADCFVESEGVKIDIEYDGIYWHQNKKDFDDERDKYFIDKGYKIIRILGSHKIPDENLLLESINTLLHTNEIKIIINSD